MTLRSSDLLKTNQVSRRQSLTRKSPCKPSGETLRHGFLPKDTIKLSDKC